ncbi:MAG: SpoIIE family protein phosphatase [Candidatus Omnitrophota bacterium]|nr:SpoIIE family protein phosphatase [Candidatus Omnitrophota bacterium]
MLDLIKETLAQWHYLNHPFLSAMSGLLSILQGSFVLSKNVKSRLYWAFFWLISLPGFWFLGNAFVMWNCENFEIAIFGFRLAYTAVCFMALAYYCFYAAQCKIKTSEQRVINGLIIFSIFELGYLWLSNDLRQGVYLLPNVGLIWKGMPRFSYFLLFGMVKYIITAYIIAISFFRLSKKEVNLLKKSQFKSLAFLFFALSFGWTEWLTAFDIPLHIAWVIVPIVVSIFTYSVIRYRALEIDTVIHRTLLWLTSIVLVILPAGILTFFFCYFYLNALPALLTISILSMIIMFFSVYYNRLRPRIDRFFGRKRYAHHELLGRIAEKVSTTLDIDEFSRELLMELDNCISPEKIYLFIFDEQKHDFILFASKSPIQPPQIYRDNQNAILCRDTIIAHIRDTKKSLDTLVISLDPKFDYLKESPCFSAMVRDDINLMVPLLMQDSLIGILALGKKRSLSLYNSGDIEVFNALGRELGTSIYNAIHHKDILEKQRLEQEIALAKNIQDTIIPKEPPSATGLSLYGLYYPSKEIGGDYYDFVQSSDKERLYIIIADVSGKGLDAGLVVSSLKAALISLIRYNSSPKEILRILNEDLYSYLEQKKFISMLILEYTVGKNQIVYSSAGHEHILIYRNQENKVEAVKSGGVVLGMFEDISSHLEEKTIILNPKDRILLYTDGVTGAKNSRDERFGLESLVESFAKHSFLSLKEAVNNIYSDVRQFSESKELEDDVALVGLEKQ